MRYTIKRDKAKEVKKVGILIFDGVGIRNYLFSDMLGEFQRKSMQAVVIHPFDPDSPFLNQIEHQEALRSFREPHHIRVLREAISFAQLRLNAKRTGNKTILTYWRPNKTGLSKKLLFALVEFIGKWLNTDAKIRNAEKRLFRLVSNSPQHLQWVRWIKQLKLDYVFCTHQRVPAALPIMLAAQSLGIKTATFIFSWDNLPKARLPFRCDYYFVWSEYMKEELSYYYSDIAAEQIIVSGTPQFDFYQDLSLIKARETFAQEYGLDPAKHWVLFSGDDKLTSPYDAQYLMDVGEELSSSQDIQLLFRQVPTEETTRYDAVFSSGHAKHIPPLWDTKGHWGQSIPTRQDIALLANLAYHCKVVINLGSTMALDFAAFDHVGLYLNYDQPQSEGWSTKTIYQFQHFRTMDGLDPVGWINSKEEILLKVRQAISEPQKIAPDRKKWLEKITGFSNIESSASRICKTLSHTT